MASSWCTATPGTSIQRRDQIRDYELTIDQLGDWQIYRSIEFVDKLVNRRLVNWSIPLAGGASSLPRPSPSGTRSPAASRGGRPRRPSCRSDRGRRG